MRCLAVLGAILLVSCAAPTPEAASKTPPPATAPAPPHVLDQTAVLPRTGLVSSKVVLEHPLDLPKMPGGSVGEYEVKGKKYQMFIIDAGDNQKAAFLLIDIKSGLQNTEYLAHMGGYFGTDGTRQVYAFAKLHYLAGVVGLPKDVADPLARVFASRLH